VTVGKDKGARASAARPGECFISVREKFRYRCRARFVRESVRRLLMPGRTLEQKAVWTYRFAAMAATVEAFFLFIFGLDLTTRQTWIFFLFGLPAVFIMYGVDRWLIGHYVRPIQPALEALEQGQTLTPALAYRAWVQALNLPTLTLIRVLTVHAPSVLLPISLSCWTANLVARLDFAWWQFIVLWFFWPITAAPHAIVEYFLIDRIVQPILLRLDPHVRARVLQPQHAATRREVVRMAAGRQLPEPRIIRTATAVQLGWLFLFVSLMPMFVLGVSTYLKLAVGSLSSIGAWISLLVVINAVVSIAIVALLSMRMHRSIQELLEEMERVQAGDLSGQWSPHSTDEFLDLDNGFNQMLMGLREREHIKDTFGRFVSREVAAAILNGQVPLAGESREVTIFFQDLRGFTSMSEQMDPAALLRVLNVFFTEVVAAIEAEGGVVKQFTGDGVMALFGAPVGHVDDPARAVRAALGLLGRLDGLNTRLRMQNTPPLRVGVGIHTGEVVAGRIGPDTRVEYGVVGDPVNLASRIEGLTKELQATILVSKITAERLGTEFVLGRSAVLAVKGKQQPVEVVEVLGRTTER
jgi:class 3 adenylate cyclase